VAYVKKKVKIGLKSVKKLLQNTPKMVKKFWKKNLKMAAKILKIWIGSDRKYRVFGGSDRIGSSARWDRIGIFL